MEKYKNKDQKNQNYITTLEQDQRKWTILFRYKPFLKVTLVCRHFKKQDETLKSVRIMGTKTFPNHRSPSPSPVKWKFPKLFSILFNKSKRLVIKRVGQYLIGTQ